MAQIIKNLICHKDLLWIWTVREIKIRYKQSFIGIGWAVLQPLILMIIFSIIFSLFLPMPKTNVPYPIFSYTAVLPWTFFSTSLSFAIPSLVSNMGLITKVYFPREILPIASVGAALFDYLVASSIFIAMLAWYRVPVTSAMLWVPILLVIQVILTLGIVLPVSAMNVFYRDIRFVIPLAVQIWMYASPIIYPIDLVPGKLKMLYFINPMAGIIDSFRRVILQGIPPDPYELGLSALISIGLFFIGYWFFKKKEFQFADLI
jgi:lipopolysaccharide transport system permease protein